MKGKARRKRIAAGLGLILTFSGAALLAQSSRQPTRKPLTLPLATPRITIAKRERRLTLFSGGRIIRTYPIALGFQPVGDKIRRGDGRTPEGRFTVFTKNAQSAFYRSLGLNYPNAGDAERGLRATRRSAATSPSTAAAREATGPGDASH